MIEKIDQGQANVIGFQAIGDVDKDDYEILTPAVESAAAEHGQIRLVLDLTQFKGEKIDAWGADLRFGHELHGKIEKMALIGDQKWGKYLAKFAEPFFAQEAEWFHDTAAAWDWVGS